MKDRHLLIVCLLYSGFVCLGLPDQALGIAWPTMRTALGRSLDAAGQIVFLMCAVSAFSSFISGRFMHRFNIPVILIASSALMAFGLWGYASAQSWSILILFTLPYGLGSGVIEASLNNYVAQKYTSRHMNWLHASWGIGATAGPALMTFFVGRENGWRQGYAAMAAIMAALCVLFLLTSRMWERTILPADKKEAEETPAEKSLIRKEKAAALTLFFLYTSMETCIGVWFYSVITEVYGFDVKISGVFITLYWGTLMAGRGAAGIFSDRLGNRRLLRYATYVALAGIALLFIPVPAAVCAGLCLTGLGFSPLFPSMMYETPRVFGNDASSMAGKQSAMGRVGSALVTPAVGFVLERAGLGMFPYILTAFMLVFFILSRFLYPKEKINHCKA